MEPDLMSPAQREAICKAWTILTEHFDHVLLVVDWERTGDDSNLENCHEGYWHGGAMPALGLSRFADQRILESSKRQSQEPL